ncbi:hypothetical protein [Actinomadura sp. SCN-SB]|uniref:hypothetical protein n=1 Tax=Actinomadura sp. SCN-SB TaxID=3373092 RepID=UPI003751B16A
MRRRGPITLVLLMLLATATPACGNKNGAATTGASRRAAANDQEKMRQYAKCMRANGIDMPDPSAEGGRITVERRQSADAINRQKAQAAEKKCRHLMPNGGKPAKPKAEQLAELRAMAKCMRENGVPSFPDPNPNGGIVINQQGGGGPKINPDDPVFKAAEKKCRPKGMDKPARIRRGG